MPCEECTITLEDVAFQPRVPMSGPPIIVPKKIDIDGKRVKLTWLKSAFELDGNSSNREVDCAAYFATYRGYADVR
ncbi:hypothetical protein GQ457_15G014870 [Hibiscus cannabinus]